MILYHGTTLKRAQMILKDHKISNQAKPFYTKEQNGKGYTTTGYVYLSNEIIYAAWYASTHCDVDHSGYFYIFRVEIPYELLEPDYDETRIQEGAYDKESYQDDLSCTLSELKSCRVPFAIDFKKHHVEYALINKNTISDNKETFKYCGMGLEYAINNRTRAQKDFIASLNWMSPPRADVIPESGSY